MRRYFFTGLTAVALYVMTAQGAEPAGPTTAPFTNRLARERSPYLLQHAHNPVDWYPWGEEAFAAARKEGKPIFLSVGYSTCHWCHVMERESFSDPAVAKLINDNFIAIKVDREQRPDVDAVFMDFVAATTGSGGWPMTVFLTPDLKPFFGGTYFPPEGHDGLPGLKTLLGNVHQAWVTDREKIERSAESVARQLRQISVVPPDPTAVLEAQLLDDAARKFAVEYDAKFPGFGLAPKFPRPAALRFCLREFARTGKLEPRDMALSTLRAMAAGGIHDQLGGGFHRYSTDRRWFLPHFEKMLYDQAELATAYLDAWQITHDAFHADAVRDILDYVLRDMTGDDGRFFCAEDADSATDPSHPDERHEGAAYVWSAREIEAALGPADAALFNYRYGVEAGGNVEADPRHEFEGHNVLFIAHSIEETAKHAGKTPAEIETSLRLSRQKLLAIRQQRPRPARDEKSLTGWNGLMISALARAGGALGEERYRVAAIRAAEFVRDKLYDRGTGLLRRTYFDGQAGVVGLLGDYALAIQGLIDLYQVTLDIRWLSFATELQHKQDELFADAKSGGYFDAPAGDASLLLRPRQIEDNGEPAGNSVAALNLVRLSRMMDDASLRTEAERTLHAFSTFAKQSPSSAPGLLIASSAWLAPPQQIVLAGAPGAADTRALQAEIFAHYLPNAVILGADGADGQAFLARQVPFLGEVRRIDDRATAFVCENFSCKLPMNDRKKLAELLTPGGGETHR